MDPLTDFLDHGMLPFVGRDAEIDRIARFWRGAVDAGELRIMLMTGEAGIGKSRLIAAAVERIAGQNGVTIHIRLYPETATSIVPLIAEGLRQAHELRHLIGHEAPAGMPETVAALRRVSRLRPSLLVIEDLHLLAGESPAELSTLLAALADETLPILCAARPVELRVLGVLERYLVDEVEVAGLAQADVGAMWWHIFGEPADATTIALLRDATAGSPFALRSALRSAVRTGAIHRDSAGAGWRAAARPALAQAFEAGVARLAEGMAVHLPERERAAAESLACLGEIFARETAACLLPNADRTIAALVSAGVIAAATTAAPSLPGGVSVETPLVFTHTLLHQHLLASGAAKPEALLGIVADGLPLYSVLPLHLLDAAKATDATAAMLRNAIERLLAVAIHLDGGPLWEQAMSVWDAGWKIFDANRDRFAGEEAIYLEARLRNRRLALLRRDQGTDEYRLLVDSVLALTAGATTREVLHQRMWAFRQLHLITMLGAYEHCYDVWDRVHEFVEEHPELLGTEAYGAYLRDVALEAARVADESMLRRVEGRVRAMLAGGNLSEEARAVVDQARAQLLVIFDTEEELAERLDFLAAERNPTGAHARPISRLAFLESIGRMREALALSGMVLQSFHDAGLDRDAFQCSLTQLSARAALGEDLDAILAAALRLCAAAPAPAAARSRLNAGIYLAEIGLLRGEAEWTARVGEAFGAEALAFWPESAVLLAADDAGLIAAAQQLPGDPPDHALSLLSTAANNENEPLHDEAASAIAAALARPLLRLDDLLPVHAVLALLDLCARRGVPMPAPVTAAARDVLERSLDWLAQRELWPCMRALLDRFAGRLPRRDLPGWRARIRRLEDSSAPAPVYSTAGARRVSMLGAIAVERGAAPATPIRGIRLRTVLGLLVGAEMMAEALTPAEFRRIAAGDEPDPELARKTSNMAVARLREALGDEAILTRDEIPRLNMETVRVDLLDAHHLLKEAHAARQRRAFMRAFPAVLAALEIVGGNVPFPGLYDEIFEAMRDDFGARLRAAALDLAHDLLRESDPSSAAEILRRATALAPDDEEIVELLSSTLGALDRRTEAARLRLKGVELEE